MSAMRQMLRWVLLLAAACLATAASAAPLPPATKAEIEALLSRLEASGCTFRRNGSWYSGPEAKAHLLRKLAYLEDKGLVQTSEQFIERGASASSVSGEPYLVKCDKASPVPSNAWLNAQLKAIRAAGPPGSNR